MRTLKALTMQVMSRSQNGRSKGFRSRFTSFTATRTLPRKSDGESLRHPCVRRASGDDLWKLTAVFCMRFVRGFDELIIEELDNKNPDIHLEAVLAAGSWGVEGAWPHIAALIHSRRTPKPLLLAAIGAVPSILPQEASEVLSRLIESDDEDIVEAVHEALAMAEEPSEEDEDDEDGLFLQ